VKKKRGLRSLPDTNRWSRFSPEREKRSPVLLLKSMIEKVSGFDTSGNGNENEMRVRVRNQTNSNLL